MTWISDFAPTTASVHVIVMLLFDLPSKHVQPVGVISDEFARNGIVPFLFVDFVNSEIVPRESSLDIPYQYANVNIEPNM